VFDPDEAERRNAKGEAVILVREETTPEDFHGIVAARAVLTARGGMTSHAAVVARGMGKCAIVGCKEIAIDPEKHTFSVDGTTVSEGDWITLDGATGRVFIGDLPTIPSEIVRVMSGALPASRADVSVVLARPRLGGRGASSSRASERRHSEGRPRREPSARKASGCVAPSTCSSRANVSPRCAR
jgi:phosphoenolpyruvate synthase/pyruvate phosphate dikinase